MGGIIARERRKSSVHKPAKPSPADEAYPEAAEIKSLSKVDTVKSEPRVPPHQKRVEEYHQELTEEMIEGLTRSSSDSIHSKARKKDVLENWLLRANYKVSPENDALERHKKSMEALKAVAQNKKERGFRRKSDQSRSTTHSKGSRARQPPSVEVYSGARTTA
ncbi:hypothetical protein ABB37_05787 [Leptomonas pyrrhocoris]|uniref:Uncharacterized protein n=1 Tax=Leptomonas pyrrhocoris TaxID=157538 RepID=A0A0M9FZX6_LEPPY|nr:hypothetical protein ABB37_05787 [Leptomonas pyrrhocoris]KPA79337.1 hypothetical protein ABB37_05787 [Leptomonas pyrrhocoris]|eukprot:XP_015657776.1 hypothetical protein ABB37_05787 [Leptomonas pyrrhocoris]